MCHSLGSSLRCLCLVIAHLSPSDLRDILPNYLKAGDCLLKKIYLEIWLYQWNPQYMKRHQQQLLCLNVNDDILVWGLHTSLKSRFQNTENSCNFRKVLHWHLHSANLALCSQPSAKILCSRILLQVMPFLAWCIMFGRWQKQDNEECGGSTWLRLYCQ